VAVVIYTTHPYLLIAAGFVFGVLVTSAMFFGSRRK